MDKESKHRERKDVKESRDDYRRVCIAKRISIYIFEQPLDDGLAIAK